MKDLFIVAYQNLYRVTREEAEYIYTISTDDYIIMTITEYDFTQSMH